MIKTSNLENLYDQLARSVPLDLLNNTREDLLKTFLDAVPHSKSQIWQDLFVLSETDFKQGGYFVEFGATNGVDLSNTHILEKRFGWRGILAEPARGWQKALAANRSAAIETKCVYSRSGEILKFSEAQDGEYSTISDKAGSDHNAALRRRVTEYGVETISLLDMLDKHGAPRVIDFLSIDTEGSELEILQAFDFGKYRFRVITCEHNFTPARQEIQRLLSSNGYVRKFESISQFDDWYVSADEASS